MSEETNSLVAKLRDRMALTFSADSAPEASWSATFAALRQSLAKDESAKNEVLFILTLFSILILISGVVISVPNQEILMIFLGLFTVRLVVFSSPQS